VQLDKALYLEFENAKRNEQWWKKEANRLGAEIRALAGDDTVVMVGDRRVITYDWINSFSERPFKEAYPQVHEQYLRSVVTEQLDLLRLKNDLPEIYRQFQQRRLELVK